MGIPLAATLLFLLTSYVPRLARSEEFPTINRAVWNELLSLRNDINHLIVSPFTSDSPLPPTNEITSSDSLPPIGRKVVPHSITKKNSYAYNYVRHIDKSTEIVAEPYSGIKKLSSIKVKSGECCFPL